MDNNFDNQDPEKEKINQIVEQSDTDSEDEYEDICYICKRPEHVAGKMIHIPNNICICSSCMQRTFDSMGDMNMDDLMKDTPFAGMSGFTMPNLSDFSQQIPNKQRLKKKKNTENKEKPVLDINSIPAPHRIKEKLDEYVVGQDMAKKIMSVAVYNHYKRVMAKVEDEIEIEKSNMLMIGPTGCGKSTIINLLLGFYQVDKGIIEIDGYDINHISVENLRKNIKMVLQETWIKTASVADNIAYGKPQATREEIIQAAKLAHAHSFIIKLSKGYDTIISDEGDGLSQGQKQLISIGRLMLDLPPILILDEATSSIDSRTELKIQHAFSLMMEGRTSFIVAHRLSTIKEADLILVMDKGSIVEQGTHNELMAKKGFYSNLYHSQFAG